MEEIRPAYQSLRGLFSAAIERVSSRTIFDNSAFAGVMRLYAPDLEAHRKFLKNYPAHLEIDQRSLADFLTSICIYDLILIDSSSRWDDLELRREGYKGGLRSNRIGSGRDSWEDSWAKQLKRLLPPPVAAIIHAEEIGDTTETEACQKAFEIMTSPLKADIALSPEDQIPNVYSAKNYIYRPIFLKINERNGKPLSEQDLVQAMYLHRGLFLQSRAHDMGATYMPYYKRGKMLSKLPPMVWAKGPNDGKQLAHLPLAKASSKSEGDYMRSLNEYYYSLLQASTWTIYENDIPFVGAAILAKARGNPSDAIEIAMECRSEVSA